MIRLAPLLLLALAACDSPHALGREGNRALRAGDAPQARAHYAAALDALGDTTASALRADLLFNAAASTPAPAERLALYDSSRRATPPADVRRARDAAYNAGTAAHASRTLDAALDRFRRALVLDPSDADARHNWEYVARQQQRQQGGQAPPPEPSDYARRVKEQAEALVAQQRYAAAYALMQEARARDETVAAFQTFVDRIGAVARIDSQTPGAPR
jgi:tetratricopeptide (TPR) repeat protein